MTVDEAALRASGLDVDGFRSYLFVERDHEEITERRVFERIDYAVRHGFDLAAFVAGDEEAADAAARAWLVHRAKTGTAHVYSNDTYWLNNLARFLGYDDVRFKARKPPPAAPRALTEKQRQRVLDWHHDDPDVDRLWRAIVSLEDQTGLRPSELAALDLDDVDVDEKRIHVRHPAKGGRRRWLPMPAWLFSPKRPLGAYLTWRRPIKTPGEGWPLWIHSDGTPRRLDGESLRNILYKIGQELGFALSCNVLRHTVGVRLRRQGHSLEFIQSWLGHASIMSTTIYSEFLPEDLERAFRARPSPDPFHRRKEKEP